MAVSAASTKDIIGSCEIETDAEGNPVWIRVRKNENCVHSPTIYFSIEGEASRYILNINPIKLIGDREYKLPIRVSPNLKSCISLAIWGHENIKGVIRVKYLNEYIDEEKEINFSKGYILKSFNKDLGEKDRNRQNKTFFIDGEAPESEEYKGYINELIAYVAGQNSWAEANWTYRDILSKGDLEVIENPINKIELESNQKSIIEIIAPKLTDYINRLYDTIEDFTELLNNKFEEVKELTKALLESEEKNLILGEEVSSLATRNEELEKKKLIIEAENGDLEQEIKNLRNQNSNLEREISTIYIENNGSQESIDSLNQKIRNLEGIIENLRQQPELPPSNGTGKGNSSGQIPPSEKAEPIENPPFDEGGNKSMDTDEISDDRIKPEEGNETNDDDHEPEIDDKNGDKSKPEEDEGKEEEKSIDEKEQDKEDLGNSISNDDEGIEETRDGSQLGEGEAKDVEAPERPKHKENDSNKEEEKDINIDIIHQPQGKKDEDIEPDNEDGKDRDNEE